MLSDPAPREEVHNRDITLRGYRREDGLYDIEGRIRDAKLYDFTTKERGEIKAGKAVHDMHVRITINEDLEITAAEAVTVAGPFRICPAATRVFGRLVGMKIGPGWRGRVQATIGGVEGCTHITELMGPVATVAYQTLFGEIGRRRRALAAETGEDEVKAGSDGLLTLRNTCIGHADDPDAVLAGKPAPAE